MVVNVIMYFCCFLSGLFFGVLFLTIFENTSKRWRDFVRTVCDAIPYRFRVIIVAVVMICLAIYGYLWLGWGTTKGGIFCGFIGGLFMYFRSGITLGDTPDYAAAAAQNKKVSPYKKNKRKGQKKTDETGMKKDAKKEGSDNKKKKVRSLSDSKRIAEINKNGSDKRKKR